MHWAVDLRHSVVLALVLTASAGIVLYTRSTSAVQGSPDAAATPQFYTEHVQPIFQANCYRCHAGMNHRGRLQLDTRESLMHGGKDGAVIVPGHPEQSLLLKLIRHEGSGDHDMAMPPKSK